MLDRYQSRGLMDFAAAISHRHGRLPAINLAFDSAWKVLAERNRPARFANDNAMRAELGERLLTLFSDGVTHPEELRRQVLATFPPCLSVNWRGFESRARACHSRPISMSVAFRRQADSARPADTLAQRLHFGR